MFCSKCGNRLNDNGNFCHFCGAASVKIQTNTAERPPRTERPQRTEIPPLKENPPSIEIVSMTDIPLTADISPTFSVIPETDDLLEPEIISELDELSESVKLTELVKPEISEFEKKEINPEAAPEIITPSPISGIAFPLIEDSNLEIKREKTFFGKGAFVLCLVIIGLLSVSCGVLATLYFGGF